MLLRFFPLEGVVCRLPLYGRLNRNRRGKPCTTRIVVPKVVLRNAEKTKTACKSRRFCFYLVAGAGFEPTTFGL